MRKVYIVFAYRKNSMRLTQTELQVLKQVSNENKRIKDIAKRLHKSTSQIYRARQNLEKYGFLHLADGNLEPDKTTHSSLILQLLSRYPNLIELLSESGMKILLSILTPKSIHEIMKETNLNKSTVYKKIRQGKKISAIQLKKKNTFVLNKKIWPDLIDLLKEVRKHEELTDGRIPVNSLIYHKNEDEILFSNTSELPAKPTAFSTYEAFGITLFLPTHFYYLPVKELSKKDILSHSLYIVEKQKDYRYVTYLILFYLKYRNEFSKINHPIVQKINKILKGEIIDGYPSLDEIKEKCALYDIRF
jgi:predicted transcriptional regulator